MAIAPIYVPQTSAFLPAEQMNLGPLMDIAKQIKEAREAADAEQQLVALYEQSLQQQQPQQQIPQQMRPTPPRMAGPPVTPPLAREMATPPPLPTPQARINDVFARFPNAPQAGPTQLAAPSPQQIIPGAIPPRSAALQPGPTGTIQQPQFAGPVPLPAERPQMPEFAGGVPMPAERPPTPDYALPSTAGVPPRYPEAGDPSEEGLDRALRVIRMKESSGRYDNVTTTTDRRGRLQHAIGAYGVMDRNVGPWTREILGRAMTPEEFLNDPSAQDVVARAKLGQYARKYGLTGAAQAWFAGERGMRNLNARDPLGTSVAAYADDFNAKMGLPPEITGGASRPPPAAAGGPAGEAALPFEAVAQRVAQNLPTAAPTRSAGVTSEQLAALYRNPQTRPLAAAFLQKQLDPGGYKFINADGTILRYSERDGSWSVVERSQKPVTAKEGESVYLPGENRWEKPPGGDDAGRYGKPGPDERWKDPNNKALGFEPVPGSGKAKIGDEIAARVGLGRSFLSVLPDIRKRIDRGDVGADNPANHAMALGNVGEPGATKRMMDTGAEALARMLTGAGMPASEANENANQYRVTLRDTAASIKNKMDGLERHMYHIGEVLGRGRGGENLMTVGSATAVNDKKAVEDELRRRGLIK